MQKRAINKLLKIKQKPDFLGFPRTDRLASGLVVYDCISFVSRIREQRKIEHIAEQMIELKYKYEVMSAQLQF